MDICTFFRARVGGGVGVGKGPIKIKINSSDSQHPLLYSGQKRYAITLYTAVTVVRIQCHYYRSNSTRYFNRTISESFCVELLPSTLLPVHRHRRPKPLPAPLAVIRANNLARSSSVVMRRVLGSASLPLCTNVHMTALSQRRILRLKPRINTRARAHKYPSKQTRTHLLLMCARLVVVVVAGKSTSFTCKTRIRSTCEKG